MIYKTLHCKLKIEQDEPHKKTGGELMCYGRAYSAFCTRGIGHVTLVRDPITHQEGGKDQIVRSSKQFLLH